MTQEQLQESTPMMRPASAETFNIPAANRQDMGDYVHG